MGDLIERLRSWQAGDREAHIEAADELARLRAEVASLGKHYADSESKLAFCDAALHDMQTRAERAEARIESAAIVRLHYNGASREWSLSREEPIYLPNYDGKRVALVRLDAEEGK